MGRLGRQFIGRTMFLVMPGIDLRVVHPSLGQVTHHKDRRHWTHRHAQSTINAGSRIDEGPFFLCILSLISPRMNTIYWANIHTVRVLSAGLCDNKCHNYLLGSQADDRIGAVIVTGSRSITSSYIFCYIAIIRICRTSVPKWNNRS